MRQLSIGMVAFVLALVVAVPVEAAKPVKPDKPGTGFQPSACRVDVPFDSADVRNAGGTIVGVPADDGSFSLTATALGGFNETRYTVQPESPNLDDVLCVEVALIDGSVSDLRVRWLGCQECGLYRATGKVLRNFNGGEVFSAGVGVADWVDPDGEKTVAVMPKPRSDTATMTVTIGIDRP